MKKRIRISIWHQKETYFKKQLGLEIVSSRTEIYSKICDQLIEPLIGGGIFVLKISHVGYQKIHHFA
jgi:hypothetical protein